MLRRRFLSALLAVPSAALAEDGVYLVVATPFTAERTGVFARTLTRAN